MELDPAVIAAYLFALVMLYLLTRLVLIPVRFLARVLFSTGIGAVVLIGLNWVGGYWQGVNLYVPVNPVTAAVAGLLGLPGTLMLLALRHWLVSPLW